MSHAPGFVISGAIALSTDIAVYTTMMAFTDSSVFVGRALAIFLATISGWLSHRRFTFKVNHAPLLSEYFRYLSVAWVSISCNYALFLLIMTVRPLTSPVLAIVISSMVAMLLAYIGMRFKVFVTHE